MIPIRRLSQSESETLSIAAAFAKELVAGDVVLLKGELGAGKTAFTKGIVARFDSAIAVTSPTFSLINTYPTEPPINHFDLYRVNDENDLVDLGVFEYLDAGSILIIEWAEKWKRNLPGNYYLVSIEIVDETQRQILIEAKKNDRSSS